MLHSDSGIYHPNRCQPLSAEDSHGAVVATREELGVVRREGDVPHREAVVSVGDKTGIVSAAPQLDCPILRGERGCVVSI